MIPNPVDMMMFLEVAEARSFTAAAAKLGKTTSAVSQAVARLEEQLNCRLLYRTTRALSLTDAGALALSHCREIKRTYEAATSELRTNEANPTGTLSITAPHALCGSIVIPALKELCDGHHELSVRVIAEDAPIDLVERQIDLSVRVGTPGGATARMSKIGALNEGLYASSKYVAERGGMPREFEDLETWNHIANEWQGSPIKLTGPSRLEIRVSPRFRCNTVHDVLNFAEAGMGVALLPDIVAAAAVSRGGLICLYPISATPIFAVHQFEGRAPAKVTQAIKVLKQILRGN